MEVKSEFLRCFSNLVYSYVNVWGLVDVKELLDLQFASGLHLERRYRKRCYWPSTWRADQGGETLVLCPCVSVLGYGSFPLDEKEKGVGRSYRSWSCGWVRLLGPGDGCLGERSLVRYHICDLEVLLFSLDGKEKERLVRQLEERARKELVQEKESLVLFLGERR